MPKSIKTQPTVLITGGARRIGKAICLSLASRGFNIAVHYHHSRPDAQKVAAEIRRHGGTCEIFRANLTDPGQTADLIPKVLKRFPKLDVLINNASVFKTSTVKNQGFKSLREHFTVNFEAPFLLTSTFARVCKQGNIINLLDTHIVKNTTRHAAYLLSKKALCELTRIAAAELAPRVRVNGIAPGLILPPEHSKSGYLDRLAKDIPLRRKGKSEQITQTVLFLLDNPYITGQVIFNDGGEHLL